MTWFNDIPKFFTHVWKKGDDYVVPVISSVGNGPKGDKGDPFTYSDMTEQEKTDLISFALTHGLKGDKGDKGDDGVSVECHFEGTSFVVTSASGTESIDIKGEKGDKGDSFEFEDFTDEQIQTLRGEISSMFYKKTDSIYTTIDAETESISIEGYSAGDIVFISIDGSELTEGTDYTIDQANALAVFDPAVDGTGRDIRISVLSAVALTAEDFADLARSVASTLSIYTFRAVVQNAESLPSSGNLPGDVYFIVNPSSYGSGMTSVVWDGSEWGSIFDGVSDIESIPDTYINQLIV